MVDRCSSEKKWSYVRLILGAIQISGTGFALALLFFKGVNSYSLAAVVITCLSTSSSVLLFGSKTPKTVGRSHSPAKR